MPSFQLKKAFTLIELLVVVALVGIIVVAVVVSINPAKRISDAQVSAISAQVASVGSAYELCLNYVNTAVIPALQNTSANCGFGIDTGIATVLSSPTPPPAGGPFLRAAPASGTFTLTAAGTSNVNGCINGVNGSYWAQYRSFDNSLIAGSRGSPPVCP